MPLSYQGVPAPGETRACTDPWKFLILRSDGDVCLCCRSPAVGNLRDQPLESILESGPAQALRRELLTGELAEHCRMCCERGVTTTAALRREVEDLLAQDDRDLIEELRAENRRLVEARSDLLRERDALRAHAANLEAERPHLAGHIANLEAERPHLVGHIANLEVEIARLREHVQNLEATRRRR